MIFQLRVKLIAPVNFYESAALSFVEIVSLYSKILMQQPSRQNRGAAQTAPITTPSSLSPPFVTSGGCPRKWQSGRKQKDKSKV
jgi:hypothetical protein